MDVNLELDDPPTREEIRKATMQLKVGKSPGTDGIPEEVCQHGGEEVLDKLQNLFTNCWEKVGERQPLSLCTKTRETNQTVQTTEAPLYSPLHVSSRLASR